MIKLNHLRLRSITRDHIYGTDIPFRDGLNIVRAGNTSGKSTSLQAIIYALGLERSLGPQLEIPLPYAMREKIHAVKDTPYENVLQSYVELEIQNSHGEIMVVHRDVIGGKDTKLIHTENAPTLSQPGATGPQRDFFILDGGAAQREDGFHAYLAKFMGWKLPEVPRFDGTECLLYLEAIFPMLFVEQKRGWSAIQGPFPTFFKIQDVSRRVLEFLLTLESAQLRTKRAELRRDIQNRETSWRRHREAIFERGRTLGRIKGIPQSPSAEFAQGVPFLLELFQDQEWRSVELIVEEYVARIAYLETLDMPKTEDMTPEIEQKVSSVSESIDNLTASMQALRGQYQAELEEYNAIESRIRLLKDDLHRNQDASKLKKLGSELGSAAGEHICPTCHQDVTTELLPVTARQGMGLEENIQFLKSQIEMYEVAKTTSSEQLQDAAGKYRSTERLLREKQNEYRALIQELIRPSQSVTRVIIEEIVSKKNFVQQLNSILESVGGLNDDLIQIAKDWVRLTDELKSLDSDTLTIRDREKLDAFAFNIRELLRLYGFTSFMPSEIHLSEDNFRPLRNETETKDGKTDIIEKEINFEISASDHIRLKWAYYLALAELALQYPTNHPKLVIFDEPGQQEIEAKDLYSLFQHMAKSKLDQVIIATSESLDNVANALRGAAVNIANFDGYILKREEQYRSAG